MLDRDGGLELLTNNAVYVWLQLGIGRLVLRQGSLQYFFHATAAATAAATATAAAAAAVFPF